MLQEGKEYWKEIDNQKQKKIKVENREMKDKFEKEFREEKKQN